MENTLARTGTILAAGPHDRTPRKAWTMGKSQLASSAGETRNDRVLADVLVDTSRDNSPLGHGFTLRVKPDRRRIQLPIPPGLDRRRPR
jgi:hypothetical protein